MNPYFKRFLFSQIILFIGVAVMTLITITAVGAFAPESTSAVQSVDTILGTQQDAGTVVSDAGFEAGLGALGKGIGAGLAVGLAGIGAGVGLGTAGAAAIGAITEKPEVFGKSLIFVVFVEAVAIYGLVISFLLLPA